MSQSSDHYQYLAYDSRTRRLLLEPAPTPEPSAWAYLRTALEMFFEFVALGLSILAIWFFAVMMSG